jgi:protease I
MNGELKGRKIAILATDGFEQVELTDPKKNVEAAGASTEVLSVKDGSIKGWKFTDWGDSVRVDKQVAKAKVDDYDALILPGGQINPDKRQWISCAILSHPASLSRPSATRRGC